MEHFEKQLCRLCLYFITDTNYKIIDDVTRELLNFVLLYLNLDTQERVMCCTCSEKLNLAFDFKSTCLYTNNVIVTYVDLENLVPVDLKEIYRKENGTGDLVDEEICRLCMQPVKKQFISVHEVDVDIYQKYIPEVNFSITLNPVICKSCVDALTAHSSFIQDCLNIEQNVKKKFADAVDVPHLDPCIKIGPIKEERDSGGLIIKSEINWDSIDETNNEDQLIKTEEFDIKYDNIEENLQSPQYLSQIPESSELIGHTEGLLKVCTSEYHENNEQLYQCEVCDYSSKNKINLRKHMLVHKDKSEVRWYECDLCDYKSIRKGTLTLHMLTHKDDSEIKWYRCTICDHKTKLKGSLTKHMLTHKDVAEVQWYECELCDFKTVHKSVVNQHVLSHKYGSDIQWYECDVCPYKSRYNSVLKRHLLRHKDASEVRWYECDKCDYKTKHKRVLNRHMLIHKDASEISWFECGACKYKSKHRHGLKKHMKMHKDSSHVQ